MKLFYAQEDSIYGLIIGLFIIGYSGLYFDISKIISIKLIPIILFSVSLILTGLDFSHNIINMFGVHVMATSLLFLNNLIDLVIEIGFFAYFTGLKIPIIVNLLPYLQNNSLVLYVGIFFLVSNAIWILMWPMIH